jgi:tRNA nucleotidyltransferase (CCA-adding enzyme)
LDYITAKAISENAQLITQVSAERIREEYTKLLQGDKAKKAMIEAYRCHLTDYTLPEFNKIMECEQNSKYHYTDVGIHTLDVLTKVNESIRNLGEDVQNADCIRWASLLHDMGKPIAKTINPKTGYDLFRNHAIESEKIAHNIVDRLKFSNMEKNKICNLVLLHDTVYKKDYDIRKFVATYGKEFLSNLLILEWADASCHHPDYVEEIQKEKTEFFDKASMNINEGKITTPQNLQIDGKDLLEIGYKGKEIGEFMNRALELCWGDPTLNDKERLIKIAQKSYDKINHKKNKEDKEEQEMER